MRRTLINATKGIGIGFGGSPPAFTPESLVQPGDSWLWADLDAALAVERNTQPVLLDVTCDDYTRWAAVNSPTLSNPGGVMRIAYNATSHPAAQQTPFIVGNYYTGAQVMARSDGTRSPRLYSDGTIIKDGTTSTDWQTLALGEFAATGTPFRCWTLATAAGYCEFDSASPGKNLSVKKITCRGNLGNLEQATAASMPWESDVDAPTSVLVNGKRVLYGTAHFAESGNVNHLHNGAGGTLVVVASLATAATLYLSAGTAASQVGMFLATAAGNRVRYALGNGTPAFVLDVTSAALAAVRSTILVRLNAGSYSVRVNGTEVLAGAPGALSSANASVPPRWYGHNGTGGSFTISRYITNAECLQLEAYLKAYYAI